MLSCLRFSLSAIVLLAASPLHSQTIQSFLTSADLSSTLAPQPTLHFTTGTPFAPLTISVDDAKRYQQMDGFGASMTDGAAWLLHDRLDATTRNRVMADLFSPTQGIGLSVLRQPIGASDLSRNIYSFDDMPIGKQDPQLRHFSARHDVPYVFPMLRQALQLNPGITVIATPWSPPGWMKSKSTMIGGSLLDSAMPAYAEYLVRSVQAFQASGIPVKYLTVQNEPLHDTTDFPGTLMQAAQQKTLIGQYLGPDLQRAGLSTKVLAYDHNWDHPEYPIEVLSDPAAAPYLAGSALHCYGGDATAQTVLHDRFPGKGIWMTECSGGTWQHASPLLSTAHLMIDSTRNWAKSVVLWGIALDTDHNPHAGGCGTCRGLVTIDLNQKPATATFTGDYYALGQASRSVHPGAVRIGSFSPGRQSLETVAFQNLDHSIALLVLNDTTTQQRFTISWRGRTVNAALLPGTFATYHWKP